VFNATTHAGAERALINNLLTVRRLGPRAFAALIGVEVVLLLGVLAWALTVLLPAATPLAATHNLTPVREAIHARVGGAVDDPLIELRPGLSARASNLRGFQLGAETYYYYIEGATNFDPLSRGAVGAGKVEILLRDSSGPRTLVIYRLL
jgi:hypothetical protein